jgi:hypothetical protein
VSESELLAEVSDLFWVGRVSEGGVQSMWSSTGDSWTSRDKDRWVGESEQGVEPLSELDGWSE